MKHLDHDLKRYLAVFAAAFIILLGLSIYSFIRVISLNSEVASLTTDYNSLNENFASTTRELEKTIANSFTALSNELSNEKRNVGSMQEILSHYRNQVSNISGKVNTLQKLSKTDPELLKKYSKVFFLNENYVPARLSEIPEDYQYSTRKQLLIHTDVLPHLKDMINAATSTGMKLYAFSAYRSFDEQRALKADYRLTYGAGTANSFSADQGYSEHQLGTALDFITSGLGGNIDGFEATSAYEWMLENAYKYGFILSYPRNNGYYVFEPWHWRYVGVKLATELHSQKKAFYDMDQREIDEYLVSIFD